ERRRPRLPRAHRPRPRPATHPWPGPPAGRGAHWQDPPDRQRARGVVTMLLRTMLKSKIHRATVTQADLHYVGSVTVDEDLMDAADLLEGEQVTIVDIANG